MKKYCTIYLTRHGETDWNEKKLIQGHTDVPLNKKGEKQAKELGKELKNIHFDAVFSSDLLRAKNSAEIIISEKKLKVITIKALRERNFGRFEGKHLIELRKTFGEVMLITVEKQKKLQLFDVENDEGIIARLIPFMKKIASNYLGKNVLMVTHGGLLRAFLSYVDYKIPEYTERPMKNAGYLIVEFDGERFEVKEEKLF
ncbi:Phosphoglycerate mutase family protein [Candidatus Roizmanbacteria bacterium]|nr:Phosphoglycerate mutase family protein [Candidatus Roizmanbacteria bacterium]